MMEDCLFCKIIEGKLPSEKVYEDAAVFAFLDVFPASEGHTLVAPKKHFIRFFQKRKIWLKLFSNFKRLW